MKRYKEDWQWSDKKRIDNEAIQGGDNKTAKNGWQKNDTNLNQIWHILFQLMSNLVDIIFFDEIGLMNDEVLGRCCKSLFLIWKVSSDNNVKKEG